MRFHATIQRLWILVALLSLSFAARGADSFGRVCVQKIAAGPASDWQANTTGASERSTFTVSIDEHPALTVTTNSSGVFTNLSLTGKHLVTIRLDGKPLTSFRFTFEGRSQHLRLWYNEFYGTWSLSDVRAGEKCACASPTPSKPEPIE